MHKMFASLSHEALNSLPPADKFVTLIITPHGSFFIVDIGPDEEQLSRAARAFDWSSHGLDFVVSREEAHEYLEGY